MIFASGDGFRSRKCSKYSKMPSEKQNAIFHKDNKTRQ